MDLDNLKKTWQETEIKPTIDDAKIQKMLDNKGQGAFAKLIKYDQLFIKLLIPCAFAEILFFYLSVWLGIIYGILFIYSFFWQRYKIKFMKGFDLSAMGILEASKCILRYKKFIIYEMVVGAIIVIPFFLFYTYYILPDTFPHIHKLNDDISLISFVVSIATSLFFSFLIYRYMYMNNIKKVQKSINEIKDFEEDNE